MQRIIPDDYVLTSVAVTEMQQCDAEWRRLKDLHDQADTRQRGEFALIDLGKRTDELRAVLLGEVRAGALAALIVNASDGGHWQSLPLPLDYLADELAADLALNRGAVIASDALHRKDARKFDGEALCFRRTDWNAWLAVATAKQERWTVPQAAVWIRTRDRAAVQGLDDRERKCLVLSALAIEEDIDGAGALAASECLRVALQRGRLVASGRRAQLEWIDGTDEPQPWILETDDERIPEEFWEAGNFSPSIGEEGDSAASLGERERWLRITVVADDCTRLWPHPSRFLTQKQKPIGAALADLMTEPAERLGWLLIRPDVLVTHLNDARERVPLDLGIFQTSDFTIDPVTHSLSADRLRWVSVMVGLASTQDALPTKEPQPPARSPGAETQSNTPQGQATPQLKFDAEKRRRIAVGERHDYDTMTLWARQKLQVDSNTADELWKNRSDAFQRRGGRPKK